MPAYNNDNTAAHEITCTSKNIIQRLTLPQLSLLLPKQDITCNGFQTSGRMRKGASNPEIILVGSGASRMRPRTPCPPETNLRRFLLVLYINFQLLENKRKKQSDLRRRQWLMPSLTGPSRTKFLAALLLVGNNQYSVATERLYDELRHDLYVYQRFL